MENLLSKIQNLPESKRKIILGVVITILALILLSFYIKNVKTKLESFEIEEDIKRFPEIQMPKF